MRIAVITYSWSQNWGAVLQAYALVEHLKSQGHHAKLIYYREFDNNCISTVKSLSDGIFNLLSIKANKSRIVKFNLFRNNYLSLTDKCITTYDLAQLNEKFDAFITGSDQVWNVGLGVCKDFYLHFVSQEKPKISYAASFGVTDIPDEFRVDTINGINNIQFLSVREKSGANIVKQLTGREAKIVLDPVFLISKNQWESIVDSKRIISKKYIFVYPTQITHTLKRIIKILKKKTGLIVISPFYIPGCITIKDMGPIDFVKYIKDAEYIIASSFHATAFSLIFNKEFFVVPHSTTGSRVVDLLKNIGADCQCIIQNDYSALEKTINFTEVNKKLEYLIDTSKQFLTQSLL